MAKIQFQRLTSACAMFDLVDRFARDRAVRGNHPRPLGSIKYFLVGRQINGSRENYDPPRELITVRNPSGYDIFFDKVRLNDNGELLVYTLDIEQGNYFIKIESEFYQAVEIEDSLPNSVAPIQVDLEPGFNYGFPSSTIANSGGPTLLRGTVRAIDGEGVANITVQVPGISNSYVTDGSGQWVLVFPDSQPDGQVTVRFEMPDNTVVQVSAVDIVNGQPRSLPQAGLQGRVIDGDGLGISDTIIEVSGHIGEVTTDHDGRWNYYFGLNQSQDLVSVTATLPSGPDMTHSNIQVLARQLVSVPDFQF